MKEYEDYSFQIAAENNHRLKTRIAIGVGAVAGSVAVIAAGPVMAAAVGVQQLCVASTVATAAAGATAGGAGFGSFVGKLTSTKNKTSTEKDHVE